MALETATYIDDLVATNPTSGDNISQGDDHIRLIKSTLKSTFPNISGAVTPTHTQINDALADSSFTPTVSGTTAAGTGTYTTQVGTYTRVSNVVFFSLNVTWTAHTGTGNMRIDGLPVAAIAGLQCPVSLAISDVTLTAGNVLGARVPASTTQVSLVQYPTGGGALANVPMDTAGTIQLTGFYFV